MKPATIEDVLRARAEAMAEHDGVPVAPVHIHGAANQLQAELITVRDGLLNPPRAPEPPVEAVEEAPPGPAVEPAPAPAPPPPPARRAKGKAQ
jgi:hypothetical protein